MQRILTTKPPHFHEFFRHFSICDVIKTEKLLNHLVFFSSAIKQNVTVFGMNSGFL